jgi:hypothetical protein
LQPDVLRDIPGQIIITQEATDKIEEGPVIAAHQLFKGALVTGQTLLH